MRLLVLSDNHRNEYIMDEIYSLYEREIDLWIHCGDSEFDEFHPAWNIFSTVQGNMDITNDFPIEDVRTFEDIKFAVVHGHLHNVKTTFEPLKELANSNGTSIVFYGHTHVPKVDKEEGVYFINPGSVSQPKGELDIGTYAIIELEGKEGHVHFYDVNHNLIEDLSQELKLKN